MEDRQVESVYPTGTEYSAYVTGEQTIRAEGGLFPNFDRLDELDVSEVSLIEDGEITPLYDFRRKTTDHFAYSRRQVTGKLVFNYSERFAQKMRRPLQSIQGRTLWVQVKYVQQNPLKRVRDVYRIGAVWERPFRHAPDPTAQETVPFSGRDLLLVGRQTADLDSDLAADLAREEDRVYEVSSDDLFGKRQQRHLATVDEVEDGDTLYVTHEATGKDMTIRLASIDTPETPKENPGARKNPTDSDAYDWPASAPKHRGEPPTQSQLDDWGEYAKKKVKQWVEGKAVRLVTANGSPPKDQYGRFIFRVEVPSGLPPMNTAQAGTDLGTHLVATGLAAPYPSNGFIPAEKLPEGYEGRMQPVEIRENRYVDHASMLRQKVSELREQAGTEQANGIWYSHDVKSWKSLLAE